MGGRTNDLSASSGGGGPWRAMARRVISDTVARNSAGDSGQTAVPGPMHQTCNIQVVRTSNIIELCNTIKSSYHPDPGSVEQRWFDLNKLYSWPRPKLSQYPHGLPCHVRL